MTLTKISGVLSKTLSQKMFNTHDMAKIFSNTTQRKEKVLPHLQLSSNLCMSYVFAWGRYEVIDILYTFRMPLCLSSLHLLHHRTLPTKMDQLLITRFIKTRQILPCCQIEVSQYMCKPLAEETMVAALYDKCKSGNSTMGKPNTLVMRINHIQPKNNQ